MPETDPEPTDGAPSSEPRGVDSSDTNETEESAFERFGFWLERQQWVAVVVFVVGVIASFAVGIFEGLSIVALAMVLAGSVPIVTGRYRSPFGTLRGFAARARGAVSVVFGLVIFSLAMAI